jgi:hypothetical protein
MIFCQRDHEVHTFTRSVPTEPLAMPARKRRRLHDSQGVRDVAFLVEGKWHPAFRHAVWLCMQSGRDARCLWKHLHACSAGFPQIGDVAHALDTLKRSA